MSSPTPWERHARQWGRVGPPLRPSPEDLAVVDWALAEWRSAAGRTDPTVVVLGVTPELCSLATGEGSRVIAVDQSRDMIGAVWPGRLRPGDAAIRGDWRALPLREGSIDVVLADGCLSILPYPRGYEALCAELLRVLAPDGVCVARCFVQAAVPLRPEEVLRGPAGHRTSFHAFKWRLAMALQTDPREGVLLADVWEAFDHAAGDRGDLARRCGWSEEAVRTIDAYRGSTARYSFPPSEELTRLFSDRGFEVRGVARPSYELGDRCPTLVLTRRATRTRV